MKTLVTLAALANITQAQATMLGFDIATSDYVQIGLYQSGNIVDPIDQYLSNMHVTIAPDGFGTYTFTLDADEFPVHASWTFGTPVALDNIQGFDGTGMYVAGDWSLYWWAKPNPEPNGVPDSGSTVTLLAAGAAVLHGIKRLYA